ncbi:MAG TPA: hypothetical protein VK165_11055 [Azonexus sp.]|nr:hypothetical protein [Azonexus sp.]
MNQLEKRLAKLEPSTPSDQVRVILITGMAAENGKPKDPQPKVIAAINMKTGETFAHRSSEEEEECFRNRACELAKELFAGVSLITFVAEDKALSLGNTAQQERNNHV